MDWNIHHIHLISLDILHGHESHIQLSDFRRYQNRELSRLTHKDFDT